MRIARLLVPTWLLVLPGCTEAPEALFAAPDKQFARGANRVHAGSAECPIPADVVVSTEPELFAAVEAASAGDVIGIDGMIGLTVGSREWANLTIPTPGVTLTCASPGSGLYQPEGNNRLVLINIEASDVRIAHLLIDGTGSGHTIYSWHPLALAQSRVEVSDNQVTCGARLCVFFVGIEEARVADNVFHASGDLGGVHFRFIADLVAAALGKRL